MQNDQEFIMKVMRMAIRRGQSHFNVIDFLKPLIQKQKSIKYSLNINNSKAYYENNKAIDTMSYKPRCWQEDKYVDNCKALEMFKI